MTTTTTARLSLARPREGDVPSLYAIYSDPRVWTHLPDAQHTTVETTDAMVQRAMRNWEANGLDEWTARSQSDDAIIGWGGCRLVRGEFWNLGYRLDASTHGHGLATELSRAAIDAAKAKRPALPVVAMMLAANPASERVAPKVGFSVRYDVPDPEADDRPCPIYSDAPLTDAQITTYLAPS